MWKTRQTWEGIVCHMSHTQEAYDMECTALARVLEWVSGG